MSSEPEERLTWEWRIFWREYDDARSALGDFSFVGLKPKKREDEDHPDIYYYLPNTFLNVKMREDEIVFKKMYEKKGDFCGYADKKKFNFPVTAEELPVFLPQRDAVFDDCEELLDAFTRHYPGSKIYRLEKKRASATFVQPGDKTRKLKAEYSEISFENRRFQTLCLESKHKKWLKEVIGQLDTADGIVSDYFRLLGLLSFNKV
jgi:hypothetical protein